VKNPFDSKSWFGEMSNAGCKRLKKKIKNKGLILGSFENSGQNSRQRRTSVVSE